MSENNVLVDSSNLLEGSVLIILLTEVSKDEFLLRERVKSLFRKLDGNRSRFFLRESLEGFLSVITFVVMSFTIVEELDSWIALDLKKLARVKFKVLTL